MHAVDAISDSPERKENSTILPQINWNSFQFYCQIRGNSCQLGLKSLSYFLPEFVLEFNWSKWTEQLDWDTFVVLYVFFTFIRASHTFGTVLAKWKYHCFIAIWNQNYPFKWMTFILKGLTNIFLNAISQYLYANEWCKVFIIVLYVAKIFHPCYLWFR